MAVAVSGNEQEMCSTLIVDKLSDYEGVSKLWPQLLRPRTDEPCSDANLTDWAFIQAVSYWACPSGYLYDSSEDKCNLLKSLDEPSEYNATRDLHELIFCCRLCSSIENDRIFRASVVYWQSVRHWAKRFHVIFP